MVIASLNVLPLQEVTPDVQPNFMLPEVTISAPKPKSKSVFRYAKEFLGFKLLGGCNTNISTCLKEALLAYTGPNVMITSLKRNWKSNPTSQHNHGKAVDLEWSPELIDFLVTEEGQAWLNNFNLMFYIEDRPGSKELSKYKMNEVYSPYVYENENATGAHVHIGIRR